MTQLFYVGDNVIKGGGDYKFKGVVVAAFKKLNHDDTWRYVVENPEGILHIFSDRQLALLD